MTHEKKSKIMCSISELTYFLYDIVGSKKIQLISLRLTLMNISARLKARNNKDYNPYYSVAKRGGGGVRINCTIKNYMKYISVSLKGRRI